MKYLLSQNKEYLDEQDKILTERRNNKTEFFYSEFGLISPKHMF